ncbi:leukocyte immunoglobulin-like receptor subfamily A member 2 [Eptesicus fuscus]|uniref:leukocyte immunoglobulin-like receptor subfamily A member 2 n=1 Tax=Eptesicus fuscus TaxID=29078 RepID=UPI0024048045|nr:leukocyte immunoglobulin-like receptor subfamily A member 2 [Eptesicus fuscus]
MSVVLPTLLYLGLCLAQSTQAQNGNLLPAVMTAQPGSMVLYKERVTILCQGPTDAKAYEIYKVEDPEPRDARKLLVAGKTSTLYIQEIKPDQTGLYHCSYKRGGHWSPISNILLLVMTGSYDKPSLSSMSGTVVAPGDNVKLQCFSRIKFEAFILTKEDAPRFTQRQSSTAQDNGQQTTFHLDRVTATQAGTYRCYGAFNEDPYVWSHPSDPLKLEVRGSYDKPSLSSMSGTVVAPGDNVKLQCFSRIEFEAFILRKEEAPQFTQRQSSTSQDNGQQTTFHLDRVTATQAGTYRCYGAFSSYPYVWSHPSDPLQLEVREAPLDPTPVEPKHPEEAPFDPTSMEPKHPQGESLGCVENGKYME